MIKTLHDEWKEWEEAGIDRETFEKSFTFAWGEVHKAINNLKKCFYIEFTKGISIPLGVKMKGFFYRLGVSIKEFGEATRLVIFIKLGLFIMDGV